MAGKGLSRRETRGRFYLNAFLWGIGNGLFSTSLVIFLIRDICTGHEAVAIQTTIAWVIAAPRIAGLLRLLTPAILEKCPTRKSFVIACYSFAPLVLAVIPLMIPGIIQGEQFSTNQILAFLVIIWCLYHLVENLGTIAFWSWLAEFAPGKIHGRFLGARERRMVAGVAIGGFAAALFTYYPPYTRIFDYPDWYRAVFLPYESISAIPRWFMYIPPACFGLFFLLISVWPLFRIPEVPWKRIEKAKPGERLRQILAPFRCNGFTGLMLLGCWIQISLGFTQSVQTAFLLYAVQISLLFNTFLRTWTSCGQLAFAPFCGKWIDRAGTFPALIASLILTATGSFVYISMNNYTWPLSILAATLWVGWIGVNIGLSKLVFRSHTDGKTAAPIAIYFSLTTLSFAISSLLGGYLGDMFKDTIVTIPGLGFEMEYSRFCFLLSGILRLLAIPLLVVVVRENEKKVKDKR